MNFRYFERICVFGETQSGKTVFCRYLAKNMTMVIAYDVFKKNWTGLGKIVQSWAEFERAVQNKEKKIIIQWDDDSEELFERTNQYIWDNCKHVTYFVDEMQNFCNSNYTPKYLRKLVTMGQEEPRRIGLVLITQLPALLDPKIIGNCAHRVSFYICEENALRKLRMSGFNEWAEKLKTLEKYHYVYCNPGARIWQICKPVPIN